MRTFYEINSKRRRSGRVYHKKHLLVCTICGYTAEYSNCIGPDEWEPDMIMCKGECNDRFVEARKELFPRPPYVPGEKIQFRKGVEAVLESQLFLEMVPECDMILNPEYRGR